MKGRSLLALLLVGLLAPSAARAEEEAITRADAEAWLRSVESAYAREDMPRLLELTANDQLRRMAEVHLRRLFKKRNYFQLESRLLDFELRPDGTAEAEILEVMRSRPIEAPSDVREKSRRRVRLQRRAGAVVAIEALEANEPVLASFGPWSPEAWTGSVDLLPKPLKAFGSPEGELRAELSVRLRNLGTESARELEFGLHPFAKDMTAGFADGARLEAVRHEGVADVWRIELPAEVPAGGEVELSFSYAIDVLGLGDNIAVSPLGAQLFRESAWYPLFSPTVVPGADRASHDLTIRTPESWTAVAPGRLQDEQVENGRRARRYLSLFPGEALAVVAGELQGSELRLTERLSAEVWRQPGAPALSAELEGALQGMARHFEGLLGPAPVDRITLVQAPTGGQRAQPAFLVFTDLELMRAERKRRVRMRQPLFYLAHQLTHLWLQDGVRPIGGPAQILTEALCDSLAFDWFDAEVDDTVSHWHRERILYLARAKPKADRPIMVTRPGARDHDVFGAGKALVVLDGYRAFAGRERWAEVLRGYAQGERGSQVGAGEILAALGAGDARLESYVAAWIVGEGFADIAVHEPTARELVDEATGETVYEIELLVENLGQGPVPVELRIAEDAYGVPWREQQLELGTNESTLLTYRLPNPVRIVEADQRMVTWQSAVSNDTFPVRKVKSRTLPGEYREVGDEDRARLEELFKSE